jgi:hypothetical protein
LDPHQELDPPPELPPPDECDEPDECDDPEEWDDDEWEENELREVEPQLDRWSSLRLLADCAAYHSPKGRPLPVRA